MRVPRGLGHLMPLRQHTWPRHHTSWLPRAPGQARRHPMIDGDHVAKASTRAACGPVVDGARQFLADSERPAPPDQRSRSRSRPSSRCRSATTEPFRVSEMRFDLVTHALPEQVLEAMTDFTDRRLKIWKTLDPEIYEVKERGDTWAVAREGSPHSPYWVILRYDWSDPRVIRWTELETNHGDPGDGFMRIEPHEAGGSQVHVEWSTHPIRIRDKLAITLIHHTMSRAIARMWRKALDRFALA
jgi:hypothetical protein